MASSFLAVDWSMAASSWATLEAWLTWQTRDRHGQHDEATGSQRSWHRLPHERIISLEEDGRDATTKRHVPERAHILNLRMGVSVTPAIVSCHLVPTAYVQTDHEPISWPSAAAQMLKHVIR